MLDYLSTLNAMHTRGIHFSLKEYMFVAQVALKENISVAYASVFDSKEFARNVPSENEEEYLQGFKRDAETLLEKQNCKILKEYIEQELKSYVQYQASTLEDYSFSGTDVQKLLSNLLHNRSEDLDDASVRDIISLIKSLYESGALDSSDTFQQHFIHIYPPFDVVCTSCGREFDIIKGLDAVCPHCQKVYKWSEDEKRFFPEPIKL
jgi:hypothetical protein